MKTRITLEAEVADTTAAWQLAGDIAGFYDGVQIITISKETSYWSPCDPPGDATDTEVNETDAL